MAKPPEKKPDPSKPPSLQVLPMNLRIGDVLVDETTLVRPQANGTPKRSRSLLKSRSLFSEYDTLAGLRPAA
jgi:hypothetical protein